MTAAARATNGNRPSPATQDRKSPMAPWLSTHPRAPLALTAALLALGLAVAIATEGAVPAAWTRTLLAVLLLPDLLLAERLTRPRPDTGAGGPVPDHGECAGASLGTS